MSEDFFFLLKIFYMALQSEVGHFCYFIWHFLHFSLIISLSVILYHIPYLTIISYLIPYLIIISYLVPYTLSYCHQLSYTLSHCHQLSSLQLSYPLSYL